ncbi:MAG: FliA/WhiG family RNA polymerase sigma factor [Clostridia bacterium]|nr:FliA/WhiG family RNA polymerase sigma factor [Clostridia bacterium]
MGREQLWMSYQGNRDLATRDKIIESYLPLVKKIVGRMSLKLPSHWDNEDVISYGIIGLLEAVERFIPAKGVKFETFATLRIRGAILDALRESTLIPRGLSENLSKVSRTIERLEQEKGAEITSEEIARALNMSVKEVDEIIIAFSHLSCVSLQESLRTDGFDSEDLSLIDTLPAPSQYNPEEQVQWLETQEKLIKAIDELTEKEKLILALYFHEQLTLKEIAYIMDITESRVSQLKSRVLLKIRLFLEKGK